MAIEPEIQKDIGEIKLDNSENDKEVVDTVSLGVLDANGKTIKTVTKSVKVTAGNIHTITPTLQGGEGLGCYKVNGVTVVIPPAGS